VVFAVADAVYAVAKWLCDIPDKAVLDKLRSKLLEKQPAPDCLPSCVQISQMKMAITNDKELAITLQIHAQQSVAIPLPAEYEQWFPDQVIVDGQIAKGFIVMTTDCGLT